MKKFEFRRALETDVNDIMNVINQAKDYLKIQGINQWQDGYPDIETIKMDIMNEYGYILLKNNEVVATVSISFDGENTYDIIYEGEWRSSRKYAVIHRLAIDNNNKGLGLSSLIIKNIENICLNKNIHSIKVDTHRKNIPMQKVIEKNNFQYCGIIHKEDKSKRLAFEKIL